jgi:DNA-binding XRE family transcriptional regulator
MTGGKMTVQELNTVIGRNITFYRKKKGWYSRELAKKRGVSDTTVSYHEHGHTFPSAKFLLMYALVLGIEVSQLFSNDYENVAITTLGKKIRFFREGMGLSQRELARKIGIVPSSVCAHEKDQYIPELKQLKKYADFFGIEISQLFSGTAKRRLLIKVVENDKCA